MTSQGKKDRATAYHEAGHAVMAWIQKVRVKKASIVAEEDRAGYCLHGKVLKIRNGELIFDTPQGRDCAERHILICLAGEEAQRLFDSRGVRAYHGQADRSEAGKVALTLNSDSKAASLYLKWLWYRAKALIASHRVQSLIEAVALELLDKGKLTGSEIETAIRKSENDQIKARLCKGKL